jgi:hypothetical protein
MKLKNKSHKKIKNKEIVTKRIKIEIEKKKKRGQLQVFCWRVTLNGKIIITK